MISKRMKKELKKLTVMASVIAAMVFTLSAYCAAEMSGRPRNIAVFCIWAAGAATCTVCSGMEICRTEREEESDFCHYEIPWHGGQEESGEMGTGLCLKSDWDAVAGQDFLS